MNSTPSSYRFLTFGKRLRVSTPCRGLRGRRKNATFSSDHAFRMAPSRARVSDGSRRGTMSVSLFFGGIFACRKCFCVAALGGPEVVLAVMRARFEVGQATL